MEGGKEITVEKSDTMKKSRTKSSRYASDRKFIKEDPEPGGERKNTYIPPFMLGTDGRIECVHTKNYGWIRLSKCNVHYLQNILNAIEAAGNKFSRAWYAIDQELKHRPTSKKPRAHEELTA
jgi:hypothetical protein